MRVICYGDSNTYGYDPRSLLGDRYDARDRWVDLLSAETGWQVENRGVNGRVIPRTPPDFPPDTDCLLIMLGDNDLLQGLMPEEAAGKLERFLTQLTLPRENILLIAPPSMQRGAWVTDPALLEYSRTFTCCCRELAGRLGIPFADAGEWDIPMAFDGVHFTEEGHRRFARGLLSLIRMRSE